MSKMNGTVAELLSQAGAAGESVDALRFSQAALNAANALCSMDNVKSGYDDTCQGPWDLREEIIKAKGDSRETWADVCAIIGKYGGHCLEEIPLLYGDNDANCYGDLDLYVNHGTPVHEIVT